MINAFGRAIGRLGEEEQTVALGKLGLAISIVRRFWGGFFGFATEGLGETVQYNVTGNTKRRLLRNTPIVSDKYVPPHAFLPMTPSSFPFRPCTMDFAGGLWRGYGYTVGILGLLGGYSTLGALKRTNWTDYPDHIRLCIQKHPCLSG
jgi:hypothetical protein